MRLLERARHYVETTADDPKALEQGTVRKRRTNFAVRTRGSYADQLIARVAVDTGAVMVAGGRLVIRDRDAVSPVILKAIAANAADVVRVVDEMQRAREYGRIARGEPAT